MRVMGRAKKIFTKHRRTKFICIVAAIIAAVWWVVFYGISPVKTLQSFRVEHGDSVSSVATRLQRDNIISSSQLFKFAIRLNGGRIQRGDYDIPAGTGMWPIAKMLAHGNVASTTIVIPEGLTIKQIKILLMNSPELSGDVECAAGTVMPVCDLHDGDIFPDTYRVARGTTRLAVLDLARKKMAALHDAWVSAGRVAPMPLRDWNDIVTLASIVQKETPRTSEMPVVASVYINRLRKNMRLQADPTVVYALTDGLGDMHGEPLLRGHLKTESPYNTYTNNGLPPGPIANVGQHALRAVLRPADTTYLFFVADGRGGHKFSRTYDEHMRHHAKWREIKRIRNGEE